MGKKLKPFMRLVLDEMPNDPDPIFPSSQGTFAGYDGAGNLMMSWDDGRTLNLLPGTDRWHVVGCGSSRVGNEEELEISFSYLKAIQDELEPGEMSKCPRCGSQFDARRGAISRRIEGITICPQCGSLEAVQDFLRYSEKEEAPDKISDWYIVKVWQGRDDST